MKHSIVYILLFISCIGFAQNEANIWYFGENAGLDFNSGSPVALLDGALNTLEGCSTISDEDGNLLFYSDGVTVWNKNHQIMQNGTGLNGHPSSTHSALVVPKPNSTNIYYIFTVDQAFIEANGIQYSEVDMTLDNGLGAITSNKNIQLHSPTTEKLTAVKKSSGNGFWVLSHKFMSNEFIAYDVTASGVNPNPIVSAVGTTVTGAQDGIGQIKIAPNGSKVAVARRGDLDEVQLFDFNATTGIVSNPLTILPNTTAIYGVEFSPNSKVLYVSGLGGRVYQYNLEAGTNTEIINSAVLIEANQGVYYSAIQLGPDSKLYITKVTGYLDVVENPNIVGVGCNYIADGVYLGGRLGQLGLPPFIQSFFLIGFEVENICVGEVSTFNANISQAYDSIIWDFGDGSTSTDENPTHTYVTAGDYEVQLSVTANGQTSNETKTITIFDVPNVNTVVTLQQCDDNLDGFSDFNLNEAKTIISANASNETITFYETLQDAETPINPIANVVAYTNQNVSSDTIWARIVNANGCYSTSQVNLVVSTTQIPDNFTRDFYQCDDGMSTTDGIATFDFSLVNAEIQALFPVGQQLIINYYRNQAEALSESNPINDITNYENIGYPNTQNIYIRVDSAINNECLGLGHHITLHVETVPVAHPVTIDQQCDDNADGVFEFDTSNIQTQLLSGQTNVTVTYTDENGNVLPSPLPNPFITASQTITARVINATSLDTDGACYDETEIDFIVDAAVVAHNVPDFIACDTDQDGMFSFDTSTVETLLLNGQSGLIVTYTDENGNVLSSPLPNPFITESQTINARVENPLNSICFDETTISFIVSETPIANTVQEMFVCDDVSNDGLEFFTLSDFDTQVLNGQSETVFQVAYFETQSNAENNTSPLPNNYQVSSASQTIYARIHNITNTNCYDITSFEVGVLYMPLAYQPDDLNVCDDQSNDGFASFDLTVQDTYILNGQSPVDVHVSYFLTQQDADTNQNALAIPFTNSQSPQTIFARVENANSENCFSTTSFDIIVNEQPVLLIEEHWSICENDTIELTADAGFDEYLWSTGETTQTITINSPGTYELTVANIYGDLRCETSKTITVFESEIATIIDIETIDFTQNNNAITIFVEGNGDYEYSLDGINYQDSNQFSNLTIDDYVVYVRDKRGCGIVNEDIYLLYYPKFFTPNYDGYNDTWQLINSTREPNNIIYIFDRYGKLLKQLSPTDRGWDGTINGNKLPSNDYWFVLQRQNGKQYRGHFTLKR